MKRTGGQSAIDFEIESVTHPGFKMTAQNRPAVLAAWVAGFIYLFLGLAWHFTNFYTDGPLALYGSVIFFIVQMPGLVLSKIFYTYDQNEPDYIKHLVALFMIAINALLVGLAVFFWKETKRRIAEGAPPEP
jgi:vacuolar-type H+-ATPase subunit I/STV1